MTTPASGEPLKIDSMVGGADPPVFIEEATLAYCVGKVLCVWDTDTDECKYCRMPLEQEGSQQLYSSGQGQLVLSTEACDGAVKVRLHMRPIVSCFNQVLIYPVEAEGLGIATEITVPVGESCKGPAAVAMSPCCTRVFVMVGGPEEQYLAVYGTDTCKVPLRATTGLPMHHDRPFLVLSGSSYPLHTRRRGSHDCCHSPSEPLHHRVGPGRSTGQAQGPSGCCRGTGSTHRLVRENVGPLTPTEWYASVVSASADTKPF